MNKIQSIEISLFSSEEIKELSYGEVSSAATISYKTNLPEENGLFCQKIFGPINSFICSCRKYSQSIYRGKVCEVCNVKIASSIVRRERFGHIELNCPIVHILMLKINPSKLSAVLNIRPKSLEEITYYVSYIVIDVGNSSFTKYQIVDQKNGRKLFVKELQKIKNNLAEDGKYSKEEQEFLTDEIDYYLNELNATSHNYSFEEILEFICQFTNMVIDTGAQALEQILKSIDLKQEIINCKNQIKNSHKINSAIIKRLAILECFYHSKNKLEWMIMNVIPVLPADLRPIVTLENGKHSASEINEHYRRIIIRNHRLKEIMKRNPAKIILNNEKRLLQEAVDGLFDNQRRNKPIKNKLNRPIKSLGDLLKGKTGRFRQNLLGKRVDYSGRSIIVPGPDLKMYECGIPREMALELYKPMIIAEVLKDNHNQFYNIKIIEKLIATQDDLILPYLDKVVKERPVLLNRAPTLHCMGIQAFEVKLTKSKVIQLCPLSTTAFNADFDGDQMAVHLPLSTKSIAEARTYMLGNKNVIGIKDGKPIAKLTQDMILGVYYLSIRKPFDCNKINFFNDLFQIKQALKNNTIKLHDVILVSVNSIKNKGFINEEQNTYLITTPGIYIFNCELDSFQRYYKNCSLEPIVKQDLITFNKDEKNVATYVKDKNQLLDYLKTQYEFGKPYNEEAINKILIEIFNKYKDKTSLYLDKLKSLGFKYATESSITISLFDTQFKLHLSKKIKLNNIKLVQLKKVMKKLIKLLI